jgi:phosphoribosylamine--glycine ligase
MKDNLKILIIGNGGHQHAVGWKISQSERCGEIYFAPGNAGTKDIGINVPISATSVKDLIEFAKKEEIDLTLAISDNSTSQGVVDEFKKENLRIFGPTSYFSKLESSRVFGKNFTKNNNIPTINCEIFKEFKTAENYLRNHEFPVVIKENNKSMGRGVFVCQKLDEALSVLEKIFNKNKLTNPNNQVVVEDFFEGIDISVHAFFDGKNYSLFPISKNYKNIQENKNEDIDIVMGTTCPYLATPDIFLEKIEENIVKPTMEGIKKERNPFFGIFSNEIKLLPAGPKIIEYGINFNDPETQTFMRLLNTDLLDIIDACIEGNLENIEINWWRKLFVCTVVVVAKGYPDSYKTEKIIYGIKAAEENEQVVIFHNGTKMKDGNLVTSSGRVLSVTATGESAEEAVNIAYEAVRKISFDEMYYRKDIGN